MFYKKFNTIALILAAPILLYSCKLKSTAMPNVNIYAIRLKPGADLRKSIQAFIAEHKLKAAWISTCVGSLTEYNIRFANQPDPGSGRGHFEIVGLSGTLSVNGSHLHISVSDSTGKTIGGHLVDGCIIYTTAEIVIQSTDGLEFKRAKDGTTPWEELQVIRNEE
ncbi:MAG: PPC domain-containing DNA-binding protein [Ferruginibacter sp.]